MYGVEVVLVGEDVWVESMGEGVVDGVLDGVNMEEYLVAMVMVELVVVLGEEESSE